MDYIDNVSLLDIKNKKVLLVLAKGKTKWTLPGGKREKDETDKQVLTRECREEIGVDIVPESIRYFETIEGQANNKPEGVLVRIKIFTAEFTGNICPLNEIYKADYLSFEEIDDISEMGRVFLGRLRTQGLID